MNKILSLIFFVFLANNVLAQQNDATKVLDRRFIDSLMHTNPFGVYLSHDEFLKGTPSLPHKFEIVQRSQQRQTFIVGAKSMVLMVVDAETNRWKRFHRPFWCTMDAEEMFLKKGNRIYHLAYSGRYCVVSNVQWKKFANASGTVTTYEDTEVVRTEIVDLKTNQWYPYSVAGMKALLLAVDKSLSDQYIEDSGKKRKINQYLNRLNEF